MNAYYLSGMKTYILIAFFSGLTFVSCQKTSDTGGVASFQLNGKSVSAATNYFEFDYYDSIFSSADFIFITGKPNEGYFDLHIGPLNRNSFYSLYHTDSLSTGANYNSILYNYTLDSIRVLQSGSFQVNFSRLANNSADGSFSGIVTGIDTTTATTISDTLTQGIFKNIPVQRIYH